MHTVALPMFRAAVAILLGCAAVLAMAGHVSAAELTATSVIGGSNQIGQRDLGRAVVSEVGHTWTTGSDNKTTNHKLKFTITASNGDVYVPVSTTGRNGAILWVGIGLGQMASTLTSDAEQSGGRYKVAKGESESFELTYASTNRGYFAMSPKAIRYSNAPTTRLMQVMIPKTDMPARPGRPVATTTPVASTSPVKVYCTNGTSTYPVGTERTSITNADGTTSVISDAKFVCRLKDGRAQWVREGSLPSKPTNPNCINGATSPSTKSNIGITGQRPLFPDCDRVGSTTRPGWGSGSDSSSVMCRFRGISYAQGAMHPSSTTQSGARMSITNKMVPQHCDKGEWKPVPRPQHPGWSGSSTAPRSGFGIVRGASTDVHVQMAAILGVMQEMLDEIKAQQ